MATDDQQRQHRELEEIRRGFVEMGARMGSLFEPAELDEQEQPAAAPPAPHLPHRRGPPGGAAPRGGSA